MPVTRPCDSKGSLVLPLDSRLRQRFPRANGFCNLAKLRQIFQLRSFPQPRIVKSELVKTLQFDLREYMKAIKVIVSGVQQANQGYVSALRFDRNGPPLHLPSCSA